MPEPTLARLSTAVKRIAHPASTSIAYIEFHDGYVYLISPFFDTDSIELSRLRVHPGQYFNHILRPRAGFQAQRLNAWPNLIGARSFFVYLIIA